ncbi:MAG: hypothetical protein HG454_006840 [Clostridiales bacterium]|nr:hypothetical protein [Clostridiales bacterium]
MQRFGLYGYIASKYKLSDAINIYISLEVITFIIIEVVKYVFLDKLFMRLQKDH